MHKAKCVGTARLLLLAVWCWSQISLTAHATHIKAGDITSVRTGVNTYCFTITMYTFKGSQADSPQLTVNFGDGTTGLAVRGPNDRRDFATDTWLNIYRICHTFPGSGAYRISFSEENRNDGVRNMTNSVLTPFSVEHVIIISPAIVANNSPTLRLPPLDVACVGQKFFHNPGAFDIDGDSIAYRMYIPKQSNTDFVAGYRDPNRVGNGTREDGSPNPTFSINPITGDLTWDSPALRGEYNVAFIIEEWRNGVRIGYLVRDMQILVEDCNNKRPRLTVPNLCVVADDDPTTTSNIINQTITATDPDINPLDEIRIIVNPGSGQGLLQGIFDPRLFQIVATFTFNTPQTSPASGLFRWDVRAEHVRAQPYTVSFKAQDFPRPPRTPSLIDIQTMQIQVKGAPPRNLTVSPSGRGAVLNWEAYASVLPASYPASRRDSMTVRVWRRDGCIGNLSCPQDPASSGYRLIGTANINATSFNDPGPLAYGLSYSYVITVSYPAPRGGTSLASNEACYFLPPNAPLFTKVSVDVTNPNTTTTNGNIQVEWLRPRPLDPNIAATFLPPFRYELYRATNPANPSYTLINTQNDATGNQINFSFNDVNLNTRDVQYLYKIRWYFRAGTINETEGFASDSASSVRLTTIPAENSIILTWDYRTPWSNQNQIHEIYRAEAGQPKTNFVKIGQVLVGQRRFLDDGTFGNLCLDPQKSYCYYVKTKGSYNNPTQIPEPTEGLLNDAQISCATPLDRTPPPPPDLAIVNDSCRNFDINNIVNRLYWTPNRNVPTCQRGATFRLYYRPAGSDAFTRLNPPVFPANYTDTAYVHRDLPLSGNIPSQAGCYYVTAVDATGNESIPSDTVCIDNCLYYELPNVFTPDADAMQRNELFRPFDVPRYVEAVDFRVYDRWGKEVFAVDNDVFLNWRGVNKQGAALSNGVYYYEARVIFTTIDPNRRVRELKGWIQLAK